MAAQFGIILVHERQLTLIDRRNGSVDSIKKIIGYLNDAKLDHNVGMYSFLNFSVPEVSVKL